MCSEGLEWMEDVHKPDSHTNDERVLSLHLKGRLQSMCGKCLYVTTCTVIHHLY